MLYSRRFAALLAVSVLILNGCASKGKTNAEPFEPVQQQGIETTGIVPELRWSASHSVDADLIFAFSPVVVEDTLCAAGQRSVACYELASGERKWSTNYKGLSAGVAMNNELVVGATATGKVIAWDVNTGKTQWTVNAGAEVTAAPAIGGPDGNGVVVVNTGAGRVRAFSANDGSELWGHEQQLPSLTLRGNAAPLIHDDVALVGFDNGHLMAIGLLDGEVRWDATVGRPEGRTELDRIVDIDSLPVVRRNDVYSSAYNTHTKALDLRNGNEVWNKRVSGNAGSTVDDSRLYVSAGDNQLYALDVYSGRIIWQLGTFDDAQEQARYDELLTAPALYKNYVLLADSRGYLHAVNASDGTRVFSKQFAGAFSAAPQVRGDTVILQSRAGTVKVIDMRPLVPGEKINTKSNGLFN